MSANRSWLRLGILGAGLSVAGIIVSGPVAVAVVQTLHPQPLWVGAANWALHYHPLQSLPYFGGIPLIAGYLLQACAIFGLAREAERPRATIALVLTGVFVTLITLNYVIQTTFIPALATGYQPELDAAIVTFSFSNPTSLSWAIEMWGWGALGVATWLWAGEFRDTRLEQTTAWLLIANGVVSVAGIVATIAWPGFVFAPAGMWSYAAWNLLVLGAGVLMLIAFAERLRHGNVACPGTVEISGKLELSLPGLR